MRVVVDAIVVLLDAVVEAIAVAGSEIELEFAEVVVVITLQQRLLQASQHLFDQLWSSSLSQLDLQLPEMPTGSSGVGPVLVLVPVLAVADVPELELVLVLVLELVLGPEPEPGLALVAAVVAGRSELLRLEHPRPYLHLPSVELVATAVLPKC